LSPEEPHSSRIPGAARHLTGEPTLPLSRIIVGEQMRCARVPVSPQPIAQFQPHTRVTRNIADVSRVRAVLCHDPELPANASVAYGSVAWLSGLATDCFQERIPRQRDTNSKRKLNWRVEQVFLKRVNNPMFHFLVLAEPLAPSSQQTVAKVTS
jgi:hypothetical protein